MKLLVLHLLIIFHLTNATKLVLVKGSIFEQRECVSSKYPSFKECVIDCGKNDSCRLAYGHGDGTCVLCNYGGVNLDSDYSSVALKMDDCPKSSVYFPPTVSIDTTSTPKKTCPENYSLSFRPDNKAWCQIIYTSSQTGMNQSDAVKLCKTNNATLSGLETIDELKTATKELFNMLISMKTTVNLWIAGVFKPECFGRTTESDCDGVKGFTFSDTYLQNYSGYEWSQNEPNILKENVEYCLNLMGPSFSIPWNSPLRITDNRSGKVSAVSCSSTTEDTLPKAVLCGRLAD